MGGVFINYRSMDVPEVAASIDQALTQRFGEDLVFRDCESMEPGDDYPAALRKALERVEVLVSVIGPQWLTLTDGPAGPRLIDREGDWVRREIARALQRRIHIVPVIIKDTPTDATPLDPDDLPADIRSLAYKQVHELSWRNFRNGMAGLLARLVGLAPSLVIPQLFAAAPRARVPDNAPSTLLRAEYAVVPFTGCVQQLADLRSWVTDSAAHSAKLIVGPAGSGKTRLARALCDELVAAGWLAGMISGHAPATQIGHTSRIDKPLLVVVNDVELRSEQLVALARAVSNRSMAARLLLLSRSDGDWLKELQEHDDRRIAQLCRTISERTTIRLGTSTSQDEQFRVASTAFAGELGVAYAAGRPPRRDGSVLDVHAAALNWVLRPAATEQHPLAQMLQHDRRHFRRLARAAGSAQLDTAALAKLCAVVTLAQPASDEQALALQTRLPRFLDADDDIVAEYVDWCRRLYPGQYLLNPVRPDAFGEYLVAATLTAAPSIVVTFGEVCTDEQIVNALTVIGRALVRHPALATAVGGMLSAAPDRIVMLGIDAAARLDEPERFVRALATSLSDHTTSVEIDTVFALMERLQRGSPALHPLRAAVFELYNDVFAKRITAQAQRHMDAQVPEPLQPLQAIADRLTTLARDALVGFIDPGSGRLPKAPDGRDIVPPFLLETLRKLTIDNQWLPRDRDDQG